MTAPAPIDDIMDRASAALLRMDYLTCEGLCLEALAQAKAARDWPMYARIVLPLQEARRQRRMIAAEGAVRLGTATLAGLPAQWLEGVASACFVVTAPHTPEHARQLETLARERRRMVEVLYADGAREAGTWALRSFAGPEVRAAVAAPPMAWVDAALTPGQAPPDPRKPGAQPADWFLDACEALGDAALANVRAPLGSAPRIDELEHALHAVANHEILHQRLADAARAMH